MGQGRAFSRHARSEQGTIALIWGIALVMVFGFMAMIMDVGQTNTTHSELQTFADHVALAAAGELDGNSDAITRANAAAANLIADSQTFANGSPVLSGVANYTLTFHSELPASDTAALGAKLTTDPRKAAFARVEVTPRTQPMFFTGALRSVLGISTTPVNLQIAAEAVAGFTQEACDITPLMFCLPYSTFTATDPANIGKQILLRTGGSGAGWGPGDFGFLDPSSSNLGPECSGENGLKNIVTCLIGASQNITTCFSQRGVDVEPGQAVGIWNDAFNMRFDEFSADTNKYKTKEKFAPAANIIKGKKNGCSPDDSVNTMALPRDTCLVNGDCADGRFGDGVWKYNEYIDKNYGDGDGANNDEDAHLTTYAVAAKNGSRYQTYLREIAYLNKPSPTGTILADRDSTGIPQCYTGSGPKTAGKRLVIAAGIDCVANPINGAAKDVPVAEFFELFLTERVGAGTGSPKKFDLLVEIVGSAGKAGYTSAGSGGIFRDVVQLYR